jgi:hypothetical protein
VEGGGGCVMVSIVRSPRAVGRRTGSSGTSAAAPTPSAQEAGSIRGPATSGRAASTAKPKRRQRSCPATEDARHPNRARHRVDRHARAAAGCQRRAPPRGMPRPPLASGALCAGSRARRCIFWRRQAAPKKQSEVARSCLPCAMLFAPAPSRCRVPYREFCWHHRWHQVLFAS